MGNEQTPPINITFSPRPNSGLPVDPEHLTVTLQDGTKLIDAWSRRILAFPPNRDWDENITENGILETSIMNALLQQPPSVLTVLAEQIGEYLHTQEHVSHEHKDILETLRDESNRIATRRTLPDPQVIP